MHWELLASILCSETWMEKLPDEAKSAHAISLMLMVVIVALLIAPASYHRLVMGGHFSPGLLHGTSRIMQAVLVLFTVVLALNLFTVMHATGQRAVAWISAVSSGLIAFWFWFGLEWIARMRGGTEMSQGSNQHLPLDKRIDQLLTEACVILPGALTLLGFQLAVTLTEAFDKLPPWSRATHLIGLGFLAFCTVLLMAPAAYHRIVLGGEEAESFLVVGGRFLLAATAALAVGLACDVSVVLAKISESTGWGLAAGMASFAVLVGAWHVCPFVSKLMASAKTDREWFSGR